MTHPGVNKFKSIFLGGNYYVSGGAMRYLSLILYLREGTSLFSAITPEIFLNLFIQEKNNIYTLLQALVANERLVVEWLERLRYCAESQ